MGSVSAGGLNLYQRYKKTITMKKSLTTIAIRPETKRKLERYRIGRESYDELLNRLLEEVLPRRPPTLPELKEMRKDEYIPLEEVLKKLGL